MRSVSIVTFLLFITISTQSAVSKEIYKWKSDGKIYFTDNLRDVPEQFRESGKIELKGSWQKRTVAKLVLTEEVKDKAVWDAKCAACHHIGEGKVDGKRGLVSRAFNLDTGIKKPLQDLVVDLRKATQGRTSDMKAMDLPSEDLQAVARYLLSNKEVGSLLRF